MSNKLEKVIEWCIFQSRWLQVPVYLGMCVVMGMYSYVFCKDVIHSLINIETFTEETMLMLAIGIVDVSMVLNLITKVSHPLKHCLFSFTFVCRPPYSLTFNT